jgi:formate dehydrogenase subunit delta
MSATEHDASARLVQMANDIGNFFRSEPERSVAVSGIANHIAKYWTPRMRQKLMAHVQEYGVDGLDELPQEAVEMLADPARDGVWRPSDIEPPGGDAG